MVDFKKALAAADKKWNKAKKRVAEDEPAFAEIPDGRYTARLVGAKIVKSEGGRLQIDYDWRIEDGEYEKKHKHSYQGLETEDNLFYMGRDLERLGYEAPDSLTDLPDILAALEKESPMAAILLRTKGDFQNVYIRKVYAADDDEETSDEETEEEVEESEDESEEESEEEESDDEAEESEEESEEEESEEEDESDEESEEESEEEEEGTEEESEEESDDEDTVEITEGMRVLVETSKGREAGEIIEILEKEEKVRVKLDNKKTVRVPIDKIEVEPDEPKRAAKKKEDKKPTKKSAPAPAKKPAKKAAPAPKKKGKK